jgi:hypothetical protein
MDGGSYLSSADILVRAKLNPNITAKFHTNAKTPEPDDYGK